jgi:branched-subunit amino acid ABC-type transport system permease component
MIKDQIEGDEKKDLSYTTSKQYRKALISTIARTYIFSELFSSVVSNSNLGTIVEGVAGPEASAAAEGSGVAWSSMALLWSSLRGTIGSRFKSNPTNLGQARLRSVSTNKQLSHVCGV